MRTITNRETKRTTIIFVCIYAFIYAIGSRQQHLLLYLSATNALTSLLAIACLFWNKRRVLQRSGTDSRETVFLLAEGLLAAGALCTLAISPAPAWLIVMQYIVYALHFLTLLLVTIFVFTFRIKKLF